MIFEAPLLLALAPIVALLVAGLVWLARRRRVRMARAWSAGLGQAARARGRWAPVIFALMALFATVALAGPRGGRAEVTTRSHALSIVMAVDISRSMLAEDVQPNRLQRAVREGQMPAAEACNDRYRLAQDLFKAPRSEEIEQLPPALVELLERASRLYDRVQHMDRRMYVEPAANQAHTVLNQIDRLQAAFGRSA